MNQQVCPTAIETTSCCFRENVAGNSRYAIFTNFFAAFTHFNDEFVLTCFVTAKHLLDFYPVFRVILLQEASRTEGTSCRTFKGFFHFLRCFSITDTECPNFSFIWTTWVPYAKGRCTVQPRQCWEHGVVTCKTQCTNFTQTFFYFFISFTEVIRYFTINPHVCVWFFSKEET